MHGPRVAPALVAGVRPGGRPALRHRLQGHAGEGAHRLDVEPGVVLVAELLLVVTVVLRHRGPGARPVLAGLRRAHSRHVGWPRGEGGRVLVTQLALLAGLDRAQDGCDRLGEDLKVRKHTVC